MLSIQKSTNVNGTSSVDGNQYAYFNAQIPDNGNISVNYSIQNREIYAANKETFDTDYDEFRKKVDDIASTK